MIFLLVGSFLCAKEINSVKKLGIYTLPFDFLAMLRIFVLLLPRKRFNFYVAK